jgi:hypothetical protein
MLSWSRRRLHALLLTEGHRVGVTVVKDAVAEWKRQRREVFVPLPVVRQNEIVGFWPLIQVMNARQNGTRPRSYQHVRDAPARTHAHR